MKKILIIGLFLIAVVSTMAVLSAETSANDNTNVTIEGITFQIPDGYTAFEKETDSSEATDIEDIDGTAIDTEVSSEYQNAAGDELQIQVGSLKSGKIDSINPPSFEKKTINGKDGYLFKEVDDDGEEKDQYKFEYLEEGKIVKITAVSEDIISQVIG